MGKLWKNFGKHYKVSNKGEVYSFKSKRLLSHQETGDGYLKISLYVGLSGFRKTLSLHRVVAELYVDNPSNKPYVNHIDGDKKNNSCGNLEWVTHSENIKHAWDSGLIKNTNQRSKKLSEAHKGKRLGEDNHRSVKVRCVNTGRVFDCLSDAAKWGGVSCGNFPKYFSGKQQTLGKHPITKEKLLWEKVIQ